MTALMEKLHNEPSIEVALVDSPGSLKAPGLVPLFVNSDIIVIPFHYDLVTVPSTASFIMFLDRLRQAMAGGMKSKLFMVPNMNDGRVGKRSELVIWDKSRETFSKYGEVTPNLSKRADMERFSTIAALDMQNEIVSPVFDKFYLAMFDTLDPVRQHNLRGIQLVENIEPRKKKAKTETPLDMEASSQSNDAPEISQSIPDTDPPSEPDDDNVTTTPTDKSE